VNKTSFDYRVRQSRRARSVRLRVTLVHGLEVVVPLGFVPVDIPAMLEHKRDWIRAALERREIDRAQFEQDRQWRLPASIALPAIGRLWDLQVRVTGARGAAVREVAPDRLEISGAIASERSCRTALGRWLVQRAHQYLVPRLHGLAQRTALHYRSVSIRRQKSRWASCSARKTISLNAKLLFLSPETVDAVLLHELCHLGELNHSARFWKLVEARCPDYRRHDLLLREMRQIVPAWAR
jgi:predicted metal-dependent hydrolase